MEHSQNSIFTAEESADLKRFSDLRKDLINVMVKDGTPDNTREIRLLNELLVAGEANIQKTAENRLKHEDNLNKEAIAESVSLLLKKIQNNKNDLPSRGTDSVEVGENLIPVDLVPGETEINPIKLNPEEFLNKGEEE